MTFQLIPRDSELGKMPYVWLAYLGFFIAPYFMWHNTTYAKIVAGVTVIIFLIIYFRTFWINGAELWRYALMITLLGVILGTQNEGASCFFIYSACSGTGFMRLRDGIILIAINVLACALTAYFFHIGMGYWLPGIGFSVLFGCSTLYSNEVSRTRNRLLRHQEEIEHLAKIAERERIARDLHDVLGHTLTMVALKSELARKLAAANNISRATNEIQEVEVIARDMLHQMRHAIAGYRSAGLDFELEQTRKALEGCDVLLDLNVEALSLAPIIENILSLVLREAVTNVIRHAKASTCHISLKQTDTAILCEINDNGVGLNNSKFGNGLRGMRERIETIGGALNVTSSNGVCIALALPLSLPTTSQ